MFGLYGFRHGHSYVHLRGFPDPEEAPDRQTTVDLVFSSVWRVACRRDFSPLNLRLATADERDEMERRVGPIPRLKKVFLLEPDSMESYVIAADLAVGEFAIGGGADSPLTSEDRAYIHSH